MGSIRLSRNLPGNDMFIKISNKNAMVRHRIRFLNPDGPSIIRFEALPKQNLRPEPEQGWLF
jgi:hypothetical protein